MFQEISKDFKMYKYKKKIQKPKGKPNRKSREQSSQSSNELYEVEEILKKRLDKKGKPEYKVKWQGYSKVNATWQPLQNLIDCNKMVIDFELKQLPPAEKEQLNNEEQQTQEIQEWLEEQIPNSVEHNLRVIKRKQISSIQLNEKTIAKSISEMEKLIQKKIERQKKSQIQKIIAPYFEEIDLNKNDSKQSQKIKNFKVKFRNSQEIQIVSKQTLMSTHQHDLIKYYESLISWM